MRVHGALLFVAGVGVGLLAARPRSESPTAITAPPTRAAAPSAPTDAAAPSAPAPDDAGGPPAQGAAPGQDTRIGAHLRVAPALWARALESARGRGSTELVADLEAHAATLPEVQGARLPPRDALDRYLARSHDLLARLHDAGVDASELAVTIDALRRPATVMERAPEPSAAPASGTAP